MTKKTPSYSNNNLPLIKHLVNCPFADKVESLATELLTQMEAVSTNLEESSALSFNQPLVDAIGKLIFFALDCPPPSQTFLQLPPLSLLPSAHALLTHFTEQEAVRGPGFQWM